MIIRDMPSELRPREKLIASGKESLSDSELLALLLDTGTRDRSSLRLAEEILSFNGQGLGFLRTCTPEELMEVRGVGPAKACRILAAVELGKRISKSKVCSDRSITAAKDAADLMMERMRYHTKEHFDVILLNARGRLIAVENVSIGDLTGSMANPRESFGAAIRRSAASVIFVHNHPGGDPSPSREDVEVTRRLSDVGKLLNIPMLDHIIIGDGVFVSMKEKNYL